MAASQDLDGEARLDRTVTSLRRMERRGGFLTQ
jgi:hypothetical protein